MKVLMTGATGFLGRYLVKIADELDWDVSILSRRPRASFSSPFPGVYQGDLTSPSERLREAFQNQDLVIHAAVDYRSERRSLEMTKTILRLCLSERVPKIIFISSQNAGFKNSQGYSRAKREAEELVQRSPLHWWIIRPTVIYDERGGFLLESLIRRAGKFCLILIPGKGEARIQPVHAEDVARAVQKLISLPSGRSLTVAGGEAVTYRQLAEGIQKRIPHSRILSIPIPLLKVVGFFHSGIREKVDELGEVKALTPAEERSLDEILGSRRRGVLEDLSLILSTFPAAPQRIGRTCGPGH